MTYGNLSGLDCNIFFYLLFYFFNQLSSTIIYTEPVLVALLQQQNRDAFSYLYDHYAPALNGVIFRMVEDRELTEDILQEVFLKIWHNFPNYDPAKGRLFTWMLQLTKNLTIDILRSKDYRQQQQIYGDENSVSEIAGLDNGNGKLDAIGLNKHILQLKPEHRILIDLAYFNGYTQEEIAKQTGIPLGTVKTRLRAAIIELKKIFQTE